MANGLRFPSNGESPASSAIIMRFETPQSNGLPIWGPSNAGVTLIWRIKYRQHTGYYVNWWYGPYSSFFWDGGSPGSYYGCHPYPPDGSSGTTHNWEIAIEGGDTQNTLGGSPKAVVKDVWFTQGVRITYNGDNTKTLRFYTALPSTAAGDVIQHVAGTGYGGSYASDHALYFGDSGWTGPGNERMSGTLGQVKIIAKVLSEADLLSEAADMTQLITADAIANIWWGKNTFATVDDLTCDYSTGRSFAWVGADKAALESLGGAAPLAMMNYRRRRAA